MAKATTARSAEQSIITGEQPSGIDGNDGAIAGEVISPASLASGDGNAGSDDGFERDEFGAVKRNADGSPRKRRGRKPGASGGGTGGSHKSPRKASETNLGGVEAILFSLHSMAAVAFTTPELALEKKEAESLATAIAAVADHYPMTIAPKTMAWVNLVMASAAIYGPRIYLIRERLKKEAEKQNSDNTTANFMPGGFGVN